MHNSVTMSARAQGDGDGVRIVPAALVAALADASGSGDDYLAACALLQVWSDLQLLAEGSGQPDPVRRRARAATARAAQAAFDAACGRPLAPARSARAGIVLRGRLDAWQDMLERALMVPMPECCGYDLGDTAVCLDDAVRFARGLPRGRRVVVVGIRGGGAFLAPRWAAGLARASGRAPPWVTLRPLGAASLRGGYHPFELDAVRRLCVAQPDTPDIVIVDDQPDTGGTVDLLAQALKPWADRIWAASIGKVSLWHGPGRWTRVQERAVLAPRPRPALWQLLREEDRPAFLSVLCEALPQAADGAAGVSIRCPSLERRYGRETAWLPWNDPALSHHRRRLINPRKTPLLVTGDDGRPLLHLRFIGEGAFGAAEFRRVQALAAAQGEAWFLDGYRIAAHQPGLRPLSGILAEADAVSRRTWLARCAALLRDSRDRPLARVGECAGDLRVGERAGAVLASLRARIGGVLPPPPSWLPALRLPVFAGSREPVRGALTHAFGDWHWQARPDGTLRRFHLEANWGGVSWPELDAASFLLAHRLGPEALEAMIAGGALEASRRDSIALSMPVAAWLWLDGCRRDLRQISPDGAALWREDLSSLWSVLSQYTDLIFSSPALKGSAHE
ncbi:hypothetical protein [Paludibacterium paludis]|nr:hypothetical protein [Paludibacterium paludis]